MLPKVNAYYNTTVIKLVGHWWENRQTDQWNRLELTERDPYKYSKLTLTIEYRQYNRASTVFSANAVGTTIYPHAKKIEWI